MCHFCSRTLGTLFIHPLLNIIVCTFKTSWSLRIPTSDDGPKECVFLLCGGDNRVHLFQEDPLSRLFQEQPIGKYFPELEKIQNKVMCMSIKYSGGKRLVAVGCQDGTLQLGISPAKFSEADLKEEGRIPPLLHATLSIGW
jgi:hypothetical protein